MSVCPQCGSESDVGELLCATCGASLFPSESAGTPAGAPVSAEAAASASNADSNATPAGARRSRARRFAPVIALAALLVLAGTGFLGYWLLAGKGESSMPEAVSAGRDYACAVLSGGTVECWGANGFGQLGDDVNDHGQKDSNGGDFSLAPVEVSSMTSATQASAGSGGACAVLAGGTVECWGASDSGRLGDGVSDHGHRGTYDHDFSPTSVRVTGITNATQVSTGYSSDGCAVLADGSVECWGLNSSGQLGDGVKDHGYVDPDGYDVSPAPVRVSGITNATQVSVGGSVACAVLSGGSVECWGSGDQLGNGAETDSSTPVRVSGITSAIQVSVGSGSTCAVLSDHTVFCWGDGGYGQLGNGTTASSATPVRVGGITSATQVSRGDFDGHTCAVLSGGTVSCWGANWFGQLGDGVIDHGHKDSAGNDFSSTPVKVSGITNATEVSVGSSGSCAILSGGSVECWGLGSTGALGDGVSDHGHRDPNGRDFSPTPVSVVGLT